MNEVLTVDLAIESLLKYWEYPIIDCLCEDLKMFNIKNDDLAYIIDDIKGYNDSSLEKCKILIFTAERIHLIKFIRDEDKPIRYVNSIYEKSNISNIEYIGDSENNIKLKFSLDKTELTFDSSTGLVTKRNRKVSTIKKIANYLIK
ncbi:hypothetical protein [Clostridium tertium]